MCAGEISKGRANCRCERIYPPAAAAGGKMLPVGRQALPAVRAAAPARRTS